MSGQWLASRVCVERECPASGWRRDHWKSELTRIWCFSMLFRSTYGVFFGSIPVLLWRFRFYFGLIMAVSIRFRSAHGGFDTFSVCRWCFRCFPSPIMVFLGFSEPDLTFQSPFLEFPSLISRFYVSEPFIIWGGCPEMTNIFYSVSLF